MVQYRAGELNQDDDVEECERQAGRVVLLNDDDAILLIEVVPASAAPFWLTPGGGVETAVFDGGRSKKPRQRTPNESCLPRSLTISGCYSSTVCATSHTMLE